MNEYNLNRFIDAQNKNSLYKAAVSDLKLGIKSHHYIWFMFPQIEGLGESDIAQYFAIADIDEAEAYLNHSILGTRLVECISIILSLSEQNITTVFPYPDNLKLFSCLTLFASVTQKNSVFEQVLRKYFDNRRDSKTLCLID